MTIDHTPQELLITVVARLLEGCGHIAVGASSPVPGSAALLVQALSGDTTRVSILGSSKNNFFTNGGVELFDCAAEGRIDAFFLGGGQIDGQANVNLVGTGGTYPRHKVRWPGSFGSAFLYFVVPKVILFREEHTRRVFVPKVDFVSAPGSSDAGVYRPGGPHALVTPLCLFAFDRDAKRFRLTSLHPGVTLEEVRDNTGFDFDLPEALPVTPSPEPDRLALLRGRIRNEIDEIYPRFVSTAFNDAVA